MENHVVFPFSEFSHTVAHCHFLLGSGTAASPNLEQGSTATFLFWRPLSTTLLLHISATHGYAFLRFFTTLFFTTLCCALCTFLLHNSTTHWYTLQHFHTHFYYNFTMYQSTVYCNTLTPDQLSPHLSTSNLVYNAQNNLKHGQRVNTYM